MHRAMAQLGSSMQHMQRQMQITSWVIPVNLHLQAPLQPWQWTPLHTGSTELHCTGRNTLAKHLCCIPRHVV